MSKKTKARIISRLTRHGFAPWQVSSSASWDSLKRRDWLKLAHALVHAKG